MRTLAKLALALSLTLTTTADAKPHKARHPRQTTAEKAAAKAAADRFVAECIHERTGPAKDGGITLADATALCKGIVRHQGRITRLAQRAADAIEACHEEVVIACEDTTVRSTDKGECSDATLNGKHAFDVCTGHGPAWSKAPAAAPLKTSSGKKPTAKQQAAYEDCLNEVDTLDEDAAAERCSGELED